MRHRINSGLVAVSQIGFYWIMNVARQARPSMDELTKLIVSLVQNGWLETLGHVAISADPRTKDADAERLAQRKAIAESPASQSWEFKIGGDIGTVRISTSDVLRAFDKMYMKNGSESAAKLIKAAFVQSTCFTRMEALLFANAILMILGKPLILEVPTVEWKFDTEADRVDLCIEENALATQGRRAMSVNDRLRAAQSLYDNLVNENAFRTKYFGQGHGQKLHRMCRFDRLFPEIGVFTRCFQNAELYPKLDKEQIYKFCEALEKNTDKTVVESIREEALAYVANPKPDGNAAKISPKGEIKTLSEQGKIKPMALAGTAIMNNDLSSLNRYNGQADLINLCWEIAYGDPKKAEMLREAAEKIKAS